MRIHLARDHHIRRSTQDILESRVDQEDGGPLEAKGWMSIDTDDPKNERYLE